MMNFEVIFVSTVFILGYTFIALEQKTKVNKTAVAVILAFLCWLPALVENIGRDQVLISELNTHLSDIAQIVFFLLGAMAIVEIIDTHGGFSWILHFFSVRSQKKLLWMTATLTFLLSAILDNVTTSIIMITLLQRLVPERKDRLYFSGIVIVAANAGGAWTPIGDLTTTMLWINGNITAGNLMKSVLLPSLLSIIVPLALITPFVKGTGSPRRAELESQKKDSSTTVFILGMGALVTTLVLKSLFDLPPFIGNLAGLSVLWIYTDIFHSEDAELQVPRILKQMDLPSILFFVGILLAVAALESIGILSMVAGRVGNAFPRSVVSIPFFGILSAVIDNVPLTAGLIGMFDQASYAADDLLWRMTAYCVGTGGSLLVIGSAAGIVVMGLESISFTEYLKKLGAPVFLGYTTGVIALFFIG